MTPRPRWAPPAGGKGRRFRRILMVGMMVAGVAAATPPDDSRVEVRANLDYGGTGHPRQTLDLYWPKARAADGRLPVVVFIHGGGWVGGSKEAGRAVLLPYVESGAYAGISIGYRLAGEATWPAQIHDGKAAIRWIRAEARNYGLDPDKIGVIGSSAGGTLATLLGTSGGVSDLEGSVGPHLGFNSRVTCVVNRFGRVNFLAEPAAARAAPSQAVALEGRLKQLFGGPLAEREELARRASPLNHLSPDDPPMLTVHGTNDQLVPFVQAEELDAAMKRAGLRHLLIPVVGLGHGFQQVEEARRARAFFDRHLRDLAVEVSPEPIVAARK